MKIISVQKNSLAAELGLQPGDTIETINGSRVKDIIDYRFKVSDEQILLKVRHDNECIEYDLEKNIDDDLGLEFEDFRIRKCANNCIFCFVDQNPEGLRSGLYFRDGDFRMSFLHGHYITLTNMGWKQLERVVKQRLSPLYISVHVTNPDQRLKMFLYGKDDLLLSKFEYLTENGIELHSQVVLCPTWNDGEHLEQTINDIHRFTPMAKSISIVPVGLTRHREGLSTIPPVTAEYAKEFLLLAEKLDEKYRHPNGDRFIYLSDEWFIRRGLNVPTADYYGDIDLEENGVGQVTAFKELWNTSFNPGLDRRKKISIGSGILIADTFKAWFIPMLNNIPNLKVNYYPIINEFYGRDEVTVTGLLTGQDIIEQLKENDLGEMVIFSDRIVSETAGERTLDNMTLDDISKAIGVPFYVSPDEPDSFFKIITTNQQKTA